MKARNRIKPLLTLCCALLLVAAGVFGTLAEAGVYPRLISTSETKIGLIVAADEMHKAVSALRIKYAL